MKGLKIENRDIVRVNGRPVVIEGLEYYSQRIKHSIRLTLGESIFEPLTGVDWNTIFSTKIPKERVLFEIKRVILKDPETISLESLETIENPDNGRTLSIQFSAITEFGIVKEEV
ncbi:hypothetical protein [Leptospira kirschneri]|uniref:PF10934 family protein n=1 Tax=Leptospira kirschneri serovar Bulgarica str. Nikolaevo TaxID=1240687 RepID=M6F6Y8_9LEPT|nr:hypothetical protein [Leptospira kirschneri]EMK22434.1 hypothetical protein LEP1GSC008_1601 [Leptospira kirschneri serovar Bulgarica str. Nikolaevo]EMK24523.1 hypothetical protein LEP1GSC008_2674 [Leptospira kirschneri serovar Bulgarica str. Nikolaevo]EMK24883.1 hypothetical protein LEP1GSC008_0556 [Leptospira kirschneri serovar Bulgarica str. Nikolaevo]